MNNGGNFTRSVEKIKGDQWLDLVRQDVALKHKTNDEYCSPCPVCGGDDRFVVWADKGKFWCRGCEKQGDAIDYLTWSRGLDFNQARDLLFPGNGNAIRTTTTAKPIKATLPRPELQILKIYQNTDEAGTVLSEKIRYDTDVKEWRFKQRRVNQDGSYDWKIGDCRQVIYNLPGILKADPSEPVFVCEGERDADTAIALGYLATTFPNQSGFKTHCEKWNIHEPFRGHHAILFVDASDTGRKYGQEKVEILAPIVKSIKVVDLFPNRTDDSDFSDWCKDRDDNDIREELRRIIDATPEYTTQIDPQPKADVVDEGGSFRTITARSLLEKHIQPLAWIIPLLLSAGLWLLVGKPKSAKSWLALLIGLAVALGNRALDYFDTNQSKVLGLFLEDSEESLRERLDLLHVHASEAMDNFDLGFDCSPFAGGGVDQIVTYIAKNPETRLIIIDTWARFRPQRKATADIYTEDYSDLSVLHSIAKQHGISILLVHHAKKGTSDDPFDQILGSTALSAATDGTLLLQRQPGNENGVLLCRGRRLRDQAFNMTFQDCVWTCLGPREEILASEASARVREFIMSSGGPQSLTQISAGISKPYDTIKKQVQRMVKRGELEESVLRGKFIVPNEDARYGT